MLQGSGMTAHVGENLYYMVVDDQIAVADKNGPKNIFVIALVRNEFLSRRFRLRNAV